MDPIRLSELIRQIEARLGQRALLVKQPTPQSESPYAPGMDCFLNCELAEKLGFTARPIIKWLGDLIEGAKEDSPPSTLH